MLLCCLDGCRGTCSAYYKGAFRILSNIFEEKFCKNSKQLLTVKIVQLKLLSRCKKNNYLLTN